MSNSAPTLVAPAPTGDQSKMPANERRLRWFEVCLVLFVACGGVILNSLYLLVNGPGAASQVSSIRWTSGIVHECGALLLVGYVLSRRGLSFSYLGFRWSIREAGVGVLVAGLSYAAYLMGSLFVHAAHYAIFGSLAHGPTGKDFFAHPSIAAIPFNLLNPFFEELIVRAYLMTEIIQLTEPQRWLLL